MIYQPSNIIPSNFAGVGLGTVDATKDITISWQVNGNSPMTAFQITIYLINSNGTLTQVHATEILTEGIPSGGFYGKDGKGNPQQFVYSLPDTPWTTWGVVNGNEYQLSITQYWGNPTNGNYPFSVEQYSNSAFVTRATPNLRVDLDDYIESDLYFVTTPIAVGNYYIINDDIIEYFYLPESLAVNDIIIIAYNDIGYYRKNGVWRNISLSTTGSGTNITDSLLYLAYFPTYTAPQTSFTGIYSQAQGDTINSVEWKISLLDEQESIQKTAPVSGQILYDTNVVNTQQLFFTPNFLQSNNIYVVSCT
ncbi:MAG: hypothetical protein IKB98_00670, partial [Clostridia bacterium]|nr:hypothetical protein [Clostridia bacterium]